MLIKDFLQQFVEGYLHGDLQNMSEAKIPNGERYGGVGYPMVSTVLAGMELLGGLLIPGTDAFDPNKGNDYFLFYWDNYFAKEFPAYQGLGKLFRKLIRNGVAHNYVAKHGIYIEKGTYRQLSVDLANQAIYIDCVVFYREFWQSYANLVQPIVDGGTAAELAKRSEMQSRLKSMETAYLDNSNKSFNELGPLNAATIQSSNRNFVPMSELITDGNPNISSASGPMGAIHFNAQSISGSTTTNETTSPL